MKTWVRNTLAIVCSLLIVGIFAATCTCTYKFNWNKNIFWWSWFGSVWLIDLFVGGYIFYKRNRTDETKTFWLFIMVLLPIVGAILALIFNYKLQTQYTKEDNDHTRLQASIFRAKKSIKIYSNSFFVSNDTFKALNFARWKGARIQLIISIQHRKFKQQLLIYTMQKALENKIELHLTDKDISESFIIIDDTYVISTPKNFNFGNIYTQKIIRLSNELGRYKKTWENDLERTSRYPLERDRINVFKKITFKVINIFYPFF
ncbi:MAG: hypothetical protein KBS35_01650 [Mycoplasma sp.]|nr:hypothetical protein [Candidatus Hennigella equi]